MINQVHSYHIAVASSADMVIGAAGDALQKGFEYGQVAVVGALAAGIAAQVIKSLRN